MIYLFTQYQQHSIKLSNDEELAYYEVNPNSNLPTLLFLHGNLSSSVNWLSSFASLKSNFHLIAVDLRGFGNSTYRNKITHLSDFGDDIADFIIKKNLENVTLIGWSMGGGVVLETAITIPHRIKNVVLLSSVGLNGYRELDFISMMHSNKTWKNSLSFFNPMLHSIEKSFIFKNRVTISRLLRKSLFLNSVLPDEEESAIVEQVMRQVNLSDVYQALIHFNFLPDSNGYEPGNDKIKQLTVPVHIWHGQLDQVVPLDVAQQSLQHLQPYASLKLFQHSGHAIMIDEREAFCKALLVFK